MSLSEPGGPADDLLAQVEEAFRQAARYSVTTRLTRAVQAAHAALLRENATTMPEARRYASVVVATARSDGVYVAWAGPALIASSLDGAILPEAPPTSLEAPPGLGGQMPPRINAQFFALGPSESLMLAPGVTTASASALALSATFQEPTDLDAAAHLLEAAGGAAAGLVIYRPGTEEDEVFDDPRWTAWGPEFPVPSLPAAGSRTEELAAPSPVLRPPEATFGRPPPEGEGQRASDEGRETRDSGLFERGLDAGRGTLVTGLDLGSRTLGRAWDAGRGALDGAVRWALPGLVLALVVGLGFLLIRDVLPAPGARDRSPVEAGRLIQEASATSDREQALAMLSEAMAILEPQAGRDATARALLGEAGTAKDRVLNLVRLGPNQVHQFPTRLAPGFQPGGLWKGERSLLVLDLGGQVLYRTDAATGTQLEAALRSGDLHEGQPLGRLVTAAWSPARGANTQGQLLAVDHVRTLISLGGDPPSVRRWLPPDSGAWQRIGPSAATFDDLFLVDTGRGEVWRYPARSPGTAGSVAVSATQEPRLPRAIDIATDGNIYLLFADGGIAKFAPRVGQLPFEVAAPDRPLVAPNALFAHPDLDRLWILETSEARVVEVTNQGTYLRQWVFPADLVQGAANLHVDAAAGELRVLTPQAVLLVRID